MKSARLTPMSLAIAAVLSFAFLRGCDCSDSPIGPARSWACMEEGHRPGVDDIPCGEGKRFVRGQCVALRCDAGQQPAGCCPGMLCTQGGECVVPPSRVTACESHGQCEEGQLCLERPLINPDGKTCGFAPVDDDGLCPLGGQPFNGRCVAGGHPPCAGDCPPGSVCNIDTNRCEEPPAQLSPGHGCLRECGAAEIMVYADPDNMLWAQCCEVSCECLTLPPLPAGRWGRYADAALTPTSVLVSGYDVTYGDLVLGSFERESGALNGIEYVDGLPSGDTVVADPNGLRGGQIGPGPNVGTHTAIALYEGAPRIAYYDIEATALKLASYDATSEQWWISIIDDGRDITGTDSGDVGRYASLLVDDNGILHVSYYAHRIVDGGAVVTAPMYARSLTDSPYGYGGWERISIDPISSCDGLCQVGEECVLGADGEPACQAARDDCTEACWCDEACVDDEGTATCRRSLPGDLEEPCGGSCPSGFACVADPTASTICLEMRDGGCGGSCTESEVCVDADGTPVCRAHTPYSTIAGLPEGVGLFTSMAFYDGGVLVVYYDNLLGLLRGAESAFTIDGDLIGFDTYALPGGCQQDADSGQFASLAVAPQEDYFAIAFQGGDGEQLWYYRGSDFVTGEVELVDDGSRDAGRSRVGAYASLSFAPLTGEPLIAYADQTQNDLMLAREHDGTWTRQTVLSEGAFGSFADIVIEADTAWLTTYQRERDELDRDTSHVVVESVDLSTLP